MKNINEWEKELLDELNAYSGFPDKFHKSYDLVIRTVEVERIIIPLIRSLLSSQKASLHREMVEKLGYMYTPYEDSDGPYKRTEKGVRNDTLKEISQITNQVLGKDIV